MTPANRPLALTPEQREKMKRVCAQALAIIEAKKIEFVKNQDFDASFRLASNQAAIEHALKTILE